MTLKKFKLGEAHVSNAHNALQTHNPVARLTQQKSRTRATSRSRLNKILQKVM